MLRTIHSRVAFPVILGSKTSWFLVFFTQFLNGLFSKTFVSASNRSITLCIISKLLLTYDFPPDFFQMINLCKTLKYTDNVLLKLG